MLLWNELRVTSDGKHLVLELSVEDSPYYNDVYIDSIVVSADYSESGPSSQIIYSEEGIDSKHYRKVIDVDGTGKSLFFVYAFSSGEPSDGAPCGCSESSIIGVAYNKLPIYKQAMSLLSGIKGCEPSRELMDFMLTDKAFDVSVQTGNFPDAINYWNLLTGLSTTSVTQKGCGCHG